MRYCLSILSLLFFISVSLSAKAFVGSVSAATGEAGRATIEAGDSSYLNPASIAYLNGYYFNTSYGSSHQDLRGNSQDFALSLTDNLRDTLLPTSLSYVQTTSDVGLNQDVKKNIKLAFGNNVSDGFAFGLGVVHQDDALTFTEHYSQTNLQMGGLIAFSPNFGIGLVADNMIPAATNIPEAYRLDQTLGLGFNYNIHKVIRMRADLVSASNNSWGKPAAMAGIENYVTQWLVLRWGAQRNNENNSNLYSAGLGFIGPVFALNYAYQTSPQDQALTRHSIDLAIPVW